MMGNSIAVVGPGAVGGTVAAWLCAAGHDVTLCARTPMAGLAVETPDGPLTATPPVFVDPAAVTPAAWVLIATKTYAVAGAARWLERLVGPGTRIAVLQNGVEHIERFAPFAGGAPVIPVVVDIPVERDAPGRMRQRRHGTLRAPADANGAAFVALFADTPIDAAVIEDFATALWSKLAINVAGAVSALTDEPNGVAWREPAARLMRALVVECVAVGRAEGAALADDLPDTAVKHYRRAAPDGINSLHADRRAGRPMEWDARNGVVGRMGRRHGIATPVSDTIADLLAAIDGRVSPPAPAPRG